MATALDSAFTLSVEGVSSPSGEWVLRYRDDGVAAIVHASGAQSWVAGGDTPVAGKLVLDNDGRLTVYAEGEVAWDSGRLLPDMQSGDRDGYGQLRVTDDGDGMLTNQWGLPRYSLRDGVIEPVSLGDRAPVSAITGIHYLRSTHGERFVVRLWDGSLKYSRSLGLGANSIQTVPATEAQSLEQDGTELTWRFLGAPGQRQWELVLLVGEQVRWNIGSPLESTSTMDADAGVAAVPVRSGPSSAVEALPVDAPYDDEWLGEGGLDVEEAYCVTAIRGVDPDEALRRLGATDEQIVTATWPQLRDRAGFNDSGVPVAAFSIGEHTVLVEDNGFLAVYRPELSRGTTAVSAYRNINALTQFVLSQDGEVVAGFDENMPSEAEGTDPGVLREPLAEMGIQDPKAYDESDEFLDDVELLCRVAGIRPTRADILVATRGAVLAVPTPTEMRRMMRPA
jgi:hypothetical protein